MDSLHGGGQYDCKEHEHQNETTQPVTNAEGVPIESNQQLDNLRV
jgi:hypothetical protein